MLPISPVRPASAAGDGEALGLTSTASQPQNSPPDPGKRNQPKRIQQQARSNPHIAGAAAKKQKEKKKARLPPPQPPRKPHHNHAATLRPPQPTGPTTRHTAGVPAQWKEAMSPRPPRPPVTSIDRRARSRARGSQGAARGSGAVSWGGGGGGP